MAKTIELKVPDIGDFKDVPIIEVMVAEGDTVAREDPLVTLESDKATMDVPAEAAGVVKQLRVAVGDRVSEGSVILVLEPREATRDAGRQGAAQDEDASPPEAEAPPAAAGGGGSVAVAVPDIGDFKDVPVIEVMVKAGDRVAEEDPLITLESDKATMDVPSPHAGTVREVSVKVGDKVSEGSPILTLEPSGAAGAPAPVAAKPETAATAPAPPPPEAAPAPRPSPTAALAPAAPSAKAHATPSVRRFARELGVDLSRLTGTGRKGRIVKEDVQRFVKEALSRPAGAREAAAGTGIPPMPEVDFSKWGEVEIKELPRIKKISGAHLHRCWLNVPHVTHHDEADITELEDFRGSLKAEAEKRGVRVTLLAFAMKAAVAALQEFPNFNASLTADGQSLVHKKYFHVGIAVDTPGGLVVPVFRDVDRKGIYDLAGEMADVSKRARDGKLKPGEMQGGCISISSLGGIGGTAFSPIVNAPEVAIIGLTRSRMAPVWDGKAFQPRLMQPVDLSYDHRVIDGAEAARFTAFLCRALGDVRRLLL